MPVTVTFWPVRLSWQLGAQLPTLLASDTKATVAVPLIAPAAAVFMPTDSDELLLAPGASRLKEPLAAMGAFAADAGV